MKKAGAPVKVLIENIPTPGAPADDQSKIHAAAGQALPGHAPIGMSTLRGSHLPATRMGRSKTPTSARSVCSDTVALIV